jgi:hypothetical protein
LILGRPSPPSPANAMSDPSMHGAWTHASTFNGSSTVMTQTLRPDGTFETQMHYRLGGGCEQHIRHYGTFEAADGALKLDFVRP